MEITELIPAFSMWKALNETIPALLNIEYSESNFQKLENIIMSKEFLNIFTFNHDSTLTFDENQMKIGKYKVFTVWLLGKFFHILSSNKTNTHNLIIEAQIRILQHLSVTERSVYKEISSFYVESLYQLNDYHKKQKQSKCNKLVLNYFCVNEHDDLKKYLNLESTATIINDANTCEIMQKNILKIASWCILERAESYAFDNIFYKGLDSLLYILTDCDYPLKLHSIKPLIKLAKFYAVENGGRFTEKMDYFFACFGQIIYNVYENYEYHNDLNDIVINFYKETQHISFNTYKNNITEFFVQKILKGNLLLSEELENICIKFYMETATTFDVINDCIDLILNQQKFSLLSIVEKYFVNCLMVYIRQNISQKIIVVSEIENCYYDFLKQHIFSLDCCKSCNFEKLLCLLEHIANMVERIKFEILADGMQRIISFFDEHELLQFFFKTANFHSRNCQEDVNKNLVLKVLTKIPILYTISNIDIIFHGISYPFLKSQKDLPYKLRVYSASNEYEEKSIQVTWDFMSALKVSKEDVLPYLCSFVKIINGITVHCVHNNSLLNEDHNCFQSKSVQEMYYNIAMLGIKRQNSKLILEITKYLKYIIVFFSNPERIFNELFLPVLENKDENIIKMILEECADFLALFYPHELIFFYSKNCLNLKIISKECNKSKYQFFNKTLSTIKNVTLKRQKSILNRSCVEELCKRIDRLLSTFKNSEIRILLIQQLSSLICFSDMLPYFCNNFEELLCDSDKSVRMEMSKELHFILENMLSSQEMKESFIKHLFKVLKDVTKKCLENSNKALQQTVLQTIEATTILKQQEAVLNIILILLFFIMMPTSGYQLDAIHILIDVSKKQHFSTNILYSTYKKEICEKIVQLSAINYELVGWDLSTSLEKISLALGFFGSRDFIIQECRYLVSFFVPLVIKIPKLKDLLNEIAVINEMQLSELLASKYGNIFLNIFLNEPENICKQCVSFVEKITGMNSSILRKRNFQVMLNELLLNFDAKPDHVVAALKSLAREDSNSQLISTKDLPDYLQPRLLGVLAYFDIKLISKYSAKEKVLLSLAKVLEFMGPKHVTPVRFKIIAMLRTALNLNYGNFPMLNCHVWEAFVRSCEIDALGPQIALIFISLLPLHSHFPQRIENIFRYLIIENEKYMKEYIPDLFFVLENDVNEEICYVIRNHLKEFGSYSFKEHLKWFLKYVYHESSDIKVQALKYLKKLLEKNREELDLMILGYNGIDPTIVELLDVLVLGCRDTDEALKLGCGMCFGELGAIEPSHLPRRYTQKAQSFTFYITEDSFIIDALNELTRALQAEKNTQNMDRFALAIQEILKMYGISPQANSNRSIQWNNFPESQRELMLPLLSSRYTVVQTFEIPSVSPIFGSHLGTSFHSWVYNWICVLITAIKPDKKSLLQVCLPSLKQDNRTLMLFLPYILLHALLEGSDDLRQKIYEEIMALLNSYNSKRNLDPEVIETKPLRTLFSSSKPQPVASEEDVQSQCMKVIFILLDFLDRWLREWEWSKGALGRENENYVCLHNFLSRFCKLQIARCNYYCSEFARALLFIEQYISEDSSTLPFNLGFLSEIYAQLDEPDGVAGVMALQNVEPSMEQRILALEVSGKLADAAACYERIHPPLKPHHLRGLVQCYLDLDNVNTALNFVEGALARQPECSNTLMEIQAEPLWRLGHYDDLENLLQKPQLKNNNSWGVKIGQALLNLRKESRNEFKNILNELRMQQIENLGAASLEEGAYCHGYNNIARLHILDEFEQIENIIHDLLIRPNDTNVAKNVIKNLKEEWDLRIKIVQDSLKIREPILRLRRILLEQAKYLLSNRVPSAIPLLDSLLGELWLFSAKAARAAGVHQQAYTYTLKAEEYAPPRLFIEKAKLHWLREEHEQALTILRRGLEEICPLETGSSASSSSGPSDGNKDILTFEQRLVLNNTVCSVNPDPKSKNSLF